MRIYLAGLNGRKKLLLSGESEHREREGMKICLSGTGLWKYAADGSNLFTVEGAKQLYILESFAYIKADDLLIPLIPYFKDFILESFAYIKADDLLIPLIPYFKDFILDSGAFTFLSQKKHGDFDSYLKSYIDFINKYDIQKFFELDLDDIVGYKKVLEYRKRLESETGKKSIPVWHYSRGLELFDEMCEQYDYVAIGGMCTKEFPARKLKYLPALIRRAHQHGAKIHGLGFTRMSLLDKCHFDSVDSSSWTSGNRFGHIYKFKDGKLLKYDRPKGMRVKPRETALNNFIEWWKFQQYADVHL